jgi:hypothetical protein
MRGLERMKRVGLERMERVGLEGSLFHQAQTRFCGT